MKLQQKFDEEEKNWQQYQKEILQEDEKYAKKIQKQTKKVEKLNQIKIQNKQTEKTKKTKNKKIEKYQKQKKELEKKYNDLSSKRSLPTEKRQNSNPFFSNSRNIFIHESPILREHQQNRNNSLKSSLIEQVPSLNDRLNLDISDHFDFFSISERIGVVECGLTQDEIDKIPKIFFSHDLDDQKFSKCVICLGEYEENHSITILPCGHNFHSACIESWLKKNKKCPLCKTIISNLF
ncbi:e3 ubiquitin-protein ligase rhy1a-related [Anaeramoeba ignava]|uniref:RING-type E3 ubiquitin transferase n=1 Tax=Anaeramoeba ignava TaxID=1746090 RepID=A0A9Q0L7G3_ANAIG|nr:e3 ubiquitin-protein ligase rhy1a-related [Anaeramoeba ignava]